MNQLDVLLSSGMSDDLMSKIAIAIPVVGLLTILVLPAIGLRTGVDVKIAPLGLHMVTLRVGSTRN